MFTGVPVFTGTAHPKKSYRSCLCFYFYMAWINRNNVNEPQRVATAHD